MASPSQSGSEGWLLQAESALGRKLTSIEVVGGIYCNICLSTFGNKKEYDAHYVDHSIGDADIGYTCVVCRKEFTAYPSLRNHCYLAHVAKNKHKCTHCSKTFSKQSILNSHIDTAHQFKCVPCKIQFSSKKEFHTHQIIHKNDKDKPPYQCYECGESIESIDMCELHIDEHYTSLYPCSVCNETADNKLDAAKHLTKHFGEVLTDEEVTAPKLSEDCSIDLLGGVLCNYCDELFKNRIEFDTHFAIDHGDKELVYSCNICGKQYDKYHLFGNHCYYHIAKDRFECTDCDKTFPRLSLLVVHTEAFHSIDSADKPFSCGECGYGFKSARRLCEHTRVVHDTNAMRCRQEGCGKTFESLKELVLHRRAHGVARDTWCRQCGLQFSGLAAARRHLDVHRRSRYACPVCRRAYHEKHLALKHVPTHFESVLHVCKLCGKAFKLRSRLVQHSKTHSALRTFACSFCSKAFMKSAHLQQHLNIHTGSRPFQCTACPKTFASRPNWYKHMRRVHNVVKQEIKTAKDDQNTNTKASPEAPPVTKIENNDAKMTNESGIDSTSSEMSLELESYSFPESDDSTMDSLDPTVIEKDWCILNDNIDNSLLDNSLQYTDMLPVNSTAFDSEILSEVTLAASEPAAVLREYGPEFNVCGLAPPNGGACIELDDHYLPHIDPRLTTRQAWEPPAWEPPAWEPPAWEPPAWEPRVTRVYSADVARRPILNTDIY